MTPVISGWESGLGKVHQWGRSMKRALILILILAISTGAAARDKKAKPRPGPYVFTSKASVQTLKMLIIQQNLREGYSLDSDHQLQLRFSMPARMPYIYSMFAVTGVCKDMTTKKVWTYSLEELNGATKIAVQPVWEYPDDECQLQTREFIWNEPGEMAAFQAMLDQAPISSAHGATATPAVASPATAPVSAPSSSPTSTNDQPQSTKQHAACLELAKDNPSIICK